MKPQSDQTSDAQKLRELIHEVYEEVSACLLPYPGNIVEDNVYDSNNMSSKFRLTMEVFLPGLLSSGNITTKIIGGEYVTGAELFSKALKWTNVINQESITTRASYLGSDDSSYYEAFDNALEYFEEIMGNEFSSIVTAQTHHQKERYEILK